MDTPGQQSVDRYNILEEKSVEVLWGSGWIPKKSGWV